MKESDEDFKFSRDLALASMDDEFYKKADAIFSLAEAKKISPSWARTKLRFLMLDKKVREARGR